MRQPAWDIYETVILINAYFDMLSGSMTKKVAVKTVSDMLRKRALNRGMKIDHTFRNENGINMRLEELSYIDSNSSRGLRNTSKLFRDTMKMYRKNREEFNEILLTAQSQVKGVGVNIKGELIKEENLDLNKKAHDDKAMSLAEYSDALKVIINWLSDRFTVELSYDYLTDPSKSRNDMLYRVYYGSKDVMWVYFIYSKRTHYISLETEPEYLSGTDLNCIDCEKMQIRESRPHLKLFFTDFYRIEQTLSLICDSITRYFDSGSNNKAMYNETKRNCRIDSFAETKQTLNYYLDSLKTIVEWLSGKFTVEQSYDYLSDPNKERNDMLYKIYYGAKDIMWVYLIYSKRTHYISLETEPEYLSAIEVNGLKCDRIQVRDSRPHQKFFYTRFENIEEDLSVICNSIISFFDSGCARKILTNDSVDTSNADSAPADIDVDDASIKELLIERFSYGCKYSSPIELVRMKNYYFEKYGYELKCSDSELQQAIMRCGFEYERKIYVLKQQTYNGIIETVEDCIRQGISVVFFESYYKHNEAVFQEEGIVSWEMLAKVMLKLYPKYYHNTNCIVFSNAKVTELSVIESEISRVWGSAVLQTMDYLSDNLPYIPDDKIKYCLSYSKRFIWDAQETYADKTKFVINSNQLERVIEQVNTLCDINGKVKVDTLDVEDIRSENYELSDYSFFDILCSYFTDKFDINHKVISRKGEALTAEEEIIKYCSNKKKCSQSELENVMAEVYGDVRYPVVIDAASSIMVRIDRDTYISDDQLAFDVTKIDSILDEIIDGYIGLREVNSFGLFPFCGQPWNLFLLESYCRRFSKKYTYRCITANNRNAGVIISKEIEMDYLQIMTNAVARSSCALNEDDVLRFLVDAGYILRRNNSYVVQLISDAKEIRERGNG